MMEFIVSTGFQSSLQRTRDQNQFTAGHMTQVRSATGLTLRCLNRRFLPGRCWGGTPSSHTSPLGGRGGNPVLPERQGQETLATGDTPRGEGTTAEDTGESHLEAEDKLPSFIKTLSEEQRRRQET